jgi:hypothetical protein
MAPVNCILNGKKMEVNGNELVTPYNSNSALSCQLGKLFCYCFELGWVKLLSVDGT